MTTFFPKLLWVGSLWQQQRSKGRQTEFKNWSLGWDNHPSIQRKLETSASGSLSPRGQKESFTWAFGELTPVYLLSFLWPHYFASDPKNYSYSHHAFHHLQDTHYTVHTWNTCLIPCPLGERCLHFTSQLERHHFWEGKFPWLPPSSPCLMCTLPGHHILWNNSHLFRPSNVGKCSIPPGNNLELWAVLSAWCLERDQWAKFHTRYYLDWETTSFVFMINIIDTLGSRVRCCGDNL